METMVNWFQQKDIGGFPVIGVIDDADHLMGLQPMTPSELGSPINIQSSTPSTFTLTTETKVLVN
jgi:hypothetical protein